MIVKQLRPALVLTSLFVIVTGVVFPLAVWLIGSALFPAEAGGSLLRDPGGRVVGSSLLGQSFVSARYFHGRPSAAGAGYDAASSGGTNLGPTSSKLVNGVDDDPATPGIDETYLGVRSLAERYREENGLSTVALLPADAITRSASGLDPHISPANAELQIRRVAKARNRSDSEVRRLVEHHTERRVLGVFGEPRVNVLLLNLALDGRDLN